MNLSKPITIAIVRPGPLKNMGDDTSGKQLIGKGKKLTASALRGALANCLPVPAANGAELADKRVKTYPAASRNLLLHACTQAWGRLDVGYSTQDN